MDTILNDDKSVLRFAEMISQCCVLPSIFDTSPTASSFCSSCKQEPCRGSPRVAVVPPSEMAIAGKPEASSHKRPMEPSQVGICIEVHTL